MKDSKMNPKALAVAVTATTFGLVAGCASTSSHDDGLRSSRAEAGRMEGESQETFKVRYDFEHGYSLSGVSNANERLLVEFANIAVEKQFNDAFRPENLEKSLGKIIYCECTGRRIVKNHREYYLAESARIFVK